MKKLSKILSVILCVTILVGLISSNVQMNAGALEYQASDISKIEILQKLCRPEKKTEIKNRCCMVVYVSMWQRFCAGGI